MMKLVMPVAAATLLLAGCSSSPFKSDTTTIKAVNTDKDTVPTWYVEVKPRQGDIVYGVGTGLSDDLQFSIDKAMHEAKLDLADQMAALATVKFKRYIADNASGGQGRTVQKTEKVSMSSYEKINVSNYEVTERVVHKEDRDFRTYIQLKLDASQLPEQNFFNGGDAAAADNAFGTLEAPVEVNQTTPVQVPVIGND